MIEARPTGIHVRSARRAYCSASSIARSRRVPHGRVQRASIVLFAAAGHGNAEIARRVSCTVKTPRMWRERFRARPQIASLDDDTRVGCPPTVPLVARLELVKLACSRPRRRQGALPGGVVGGFPARRAQAHDGVRDEHERGAPHVARRGNSTASVWLHSPDTPKVRRICDIATPSPDERVLCIDEKTGIQALERKHPSRTPTRRPAHPRVRNQERPHPSHALSTRRRPQVADAHARRLLGSNPAPRPAPRRRRRRRHPVRLDPSAARLTRSGTSGAVVPVLLRLAT